MMLTMVECGLKVEAHHHEVATGGQAPLTCTTPRCVDMADNVLKYKYIVKNVARRHNKTATFMPKPLFGDNGSGMLVHTSLLESGPQSLRRFALCRPERSGSIRHRRPAQTAPALCAITNPTTNSYKRLVPGYDAPINLAYSRRNRSAAIRIPVYSTKEATKRLEYRCPDGS